MLSTTERRKDAPDIYIRILSDTSYSDVVRRKT